MAPDVINYFAQAGQFAVMTARTADSRRLAPTGAGDVGRVERQGTDRTGQRPPASSPAELGPVGDRGAGVQLLHALRPGRACEVDAASTV